MIGTSRADFLFIRACILVLHNVLPLAVVYCSLVGVSLFFPALSRLLCRLPWPLSAWLGAEVAFYYVVFRPRFHALQRDAVPPERVSRAEREELFDRCQSNIPDPEAYVSKWFGGAGKDDIKREDVKEFMRWAFLDTGEAQEISDEDDIERYTKDMEKMLGRRFPEGWGNVKGLRLTMDKVNFLRRSLLWYFCVAVVDMIASCRLWLQGFHLHRMPSSRFFRLFPFRPLTLLSPYKSPASHLTYWHRPHTSKTRLPVLFIHGIGIGLYPYTNFLGDINQSSAKTGGGDDDDDGEFGMIAIELMPISFRITHAALSKKAMLSEIHAILQHHGWEQVVLVTHSYGSVIATQLLKSTLTQHMIGPAVLIDPITFLLHQPDVAHNFTVRAPVRANEHQLWYFASQDMGIAHTLGRTFFWAENIIWADELDLGATPAAAAVAASAPEDDGKGKRRSHTRPVTIVLCGQDLIVDTHSVCQYLLDSKANSKQPVNGGRHHHANRHGANGHANGHALPPAASLEAKSGGRRNKSTKTAWEWKTGPWTSSGLNVLWFEQLDHAQVFDAAASRHVVANAIKTYTGVYGRRVAVP